jgi:hypothetical protein
VLRPLHKKDWGMSTKFLKGYLMQAMLCALTLAGLSVTTFAQEAAGIDPGRAPGMP